MSCPRPSPAAAWVAPMQGPTCWDSLQARRPRRPRGCAPPSPGHAGAWVGGTGSTAAGAGVGGTVGSAPSPAPPSPPERGCVPMTLLTVAFCSWATPSSEPTEGRPTPGDPVARLSGEAGRDAGAAGEHVVAADLPLPAPPSPLPAPPSPLPVLLPPSAPSATPVAAPNSPPLLRPPCVPTVCCDPTAPPLPSSVTPPRLRPGPIAREGPKRTSHSVSICKLMLRAAGTARQGGVGACGAAPACAFRDGKRRMSIRGTGSPHRLSR